MTHDGKYLLPLLNAKRVQVFNSKALEALDIRLRAPELAFKLKGSYPTADQIQANVGVRVILMDKIPRPDRTPFIHNNGNDDEE